jgi:ABC-type multidrug transport system fused ATPase/permease subunit
VIVAVIVYFVFLSWYCYKVKKVDAGQFITILIIMFVVINTVLNITTSLNDILLKWGIIENSMTLFDTCDPVVTPYKGAARIKEGIVFQDVFFSYENGRHVFQNLNLVIPLGKVTIIEGDNGSGKSTLISLILKYHVPQCGEIFVNGIPFSTLDHSFIRQKIAYIPQSPILLNRTVYDNIAYGNPGLTKESVVEFMRGINLGDFLLSLPQGLDTLVGTYGSYLSGGQKQVVWIVKSMLMKPLVIIMDEPTASIDEENKNLVVGLLKIMMKKGNTVIMITHDPLFKAKSDEDDHYFISI